MEITIEQLQEKFRHLGVDLVPRVAKKMEILAAVVETEAKKNCTLGVSPYDWMYFPSKKGAPGAPYSVDKNPRREVEHMRDEMYSGVVVEGNKVEGIVGNPKEYALPVHDGVHAGNRYLPARPFIFDAIVAKRSVIWDGLGEVIIENARSQCV
jgi:hypothetical protein